MRDARAYLDTHSSPERLIPVLKSAGDYPTVSFSSPLVNDARDVSRLEALVIVDQVALLLRLPLPAVR